MLPYWFSAMTMKSVGKAALAMVEEVRRQFATISGLMEGTARPDYRRCVEISTSVRHRLDVSEGHVILHNCEWVDCLVVWCEQSARMPCFCLFLSMLVSLRVWYVLEEVFTPVDAALTPS